MFQLFGYSPFTHEDRSSLEKNNKVNRRIAIWYCPSRVRLYRSYLIFQIIDDNHIVKATFLSNI